MITRLQEKRSQKARTEQGFLRSPFELPRMATRKVKLPEVVEMIEILEKRQKNKTNKVVESKGDDNILWVRKIVASVSNQPLAIVAPFSLLLIKKSVPPDRPIFI